MMTEHVVDANIFIHGSSRSIPFENLVTVPEVTAELESIEARNRFENEDVEIFEPSEESVNDVRNQVGNIGSEVSGTDIKLLALAKERNGVLVTDDYHMQNLAERTGINWKGFMKEGIKSSFEWVRVCKSCGREVESKKCPYCGSETEKRSR